MYDEYADIIIQTMFNIKNMNKRIFHSSKLSPSDMSVLGIITLLKFQNSDDHNIQMSDISNKLNISKSALTQIINKLEEADLVERVYLKSDRRSTFLKLTDSGNELFENEKKYLHSTIKIVFEKMGEKESEEFIRLVKKFISILLDGKEEI